MSEVIERLEAGAYLHGQARDSIFSYIRNDKGVTPSTYPVSDCSSIEIKHEILQPYLDKYPENFSDSKYRTKSGKIKTTVIANEYKHVKTAFQYVDEYYRAIEAGIDPYDEDSMTFIPQNKLTSAVKHGAIGLTNDQKALEACFKFGRLVKKVESDTTKDVIRNHLEIIKGYLND